MLKNILSLILIIVACICLWYMTPASSSFYLNKAQNLYNQGLYKESIPIFEKGLATNPTNINGRISYVKALSKLEPTYSIQKKLYEISNSDIQDTAKDLAKSQVLQIRHKLIEEVEDNYIYNAILGKEIIHWDLDKLPIKVYIEPAKDIPEYYKENVQKAFNQWSSRTGFLKFEEIQNESDANIVVRFIDYNSNECQGSTCSYKLGYTDPVIKGEDTLQRMNLTFYKTNPVKQEFSELEIYNTALHEIGHTLGIMGHSDNSSDIMYSSGERVNDIYSAYRSDFQYLSMRDLKTIALLYRIAPTVSNTKNLHNENMFYAPIILGDSNELLGKKITELKKYIENYPNFASGYINISSVYADMADFEKALENLNIAENLANTQDEQFLIEYNRAAIYFNEQKFDTAISHAKKAQSIKNTTEIQELISEIENILNN